jgi:hypothetical protein
MNMLKKMLVLFIIVELVGCAAIPPPKPQEPQSAAIGISIKLRAPIRIFSSNADMVYFIKIDEEGDLYNQDRFIRSNYLKDGQVYFLNVEPGRYAAVACYQIKSVPKMNPYTGHMSGRTESEYTTFFPEELIKLTEVSVEAGTIKFMGTYVVDQTVGFQEADNAQLHYFQLIAPGAYFGPVTTLLLSMLSGHGDYYYAGSLHEEHCDKEHEIRFLTSALKHFKNSDWIYNVQKRLVELEEKK